MKDNYPSRTAAKTPIIKRIEPEVYTNKVDEAQSLISNDQLNDYAKNGFLFLPDFFAQNDIEKLLKKADELKLLSQKNGKKECIVEPGSNEVRSVFNVHKKDEVFGEDIFERLVQDERLVKIAETLLGDQVYIHQSRINYKPGFRGKEFYWHSDFETWHAEDGMPSMRAVSCLVTLTDNNEFNGSLMLIPSSHRSFIPCVGKTPENHHEKSLKKQEYGVPDDATIKMMVDDFGIASPKGKAGSVIFFECNILHGSNSNITPFCRTNVFFVYNSVANKLIEPFAAEKIRPNYIANRSDFSPIAPRKFTN